MSVPVEMRIVIDICLTLYYLFIRLSICTLFLRLFLSISTTMSLLKSVFLTKIRRLVSYENRATNLSQVNFIS